MFRKSTATTAGRLTAIPDPEQAMKDPKPTPREVPANVQKMTEALNELKSESFARQQALEAKIEAAQKVQDQLNRLQANVDEAADALLLADAQCASHRRSLAAMEANDLILSWGRDDTGLRPGQRNAMERRLYDYQTVLVMRSAIEDYETRVRQILVERVTETQATLSKFQKTNQLS